MRSCSNSQACVLLLMIADFLVKLLCINNCPPQFAPEYGKIYLLAGIRGFTATLELMIAARINFNCTFDLSIVKLRKVDLSS